MDFIASLFTSKIKGYLFIFFLIAFILFGAYVAFNKTLENYKTDFKKSDKTKFEKIEKYESLKI